MLLPRAISAYAPSLDREGLRAALFREGPWPRTVDELLEEASEVYGRSDGQWVSQAEEALCEAILKRTGAGGPGGPALAAPAWSRPSYSEVLSRFRQIHWMEPAVGRLDPGPVEVRRALQAGAEVVLLAPVAGDIQGLPEMADHCRHEGALLALDARRAMGSRVGGGEPQDFGDLTVLPVDGEPVPSICPGAFLFGAGPGAPLEDRPALAFRWALTNLRDSVLNEPRLLSVLGGVLSARPPAPPVCSNAPGWAVASAAARLRSIGSRHNQRAHNVRQLREHCGHLPAVEMIRSSPGNISAGAAVPLLAQGREEMTVLLEEEGLHTLPELAGWLAPPGARGPRASRVAEEALFVPLHPFFRPEHIHKIAESLRLATVRVNGDGSSDPTP